MQTRKMGTLALILAGTMLVTPATAQSTETATEGDSSTAPTVSPPADAAGAGTAGTDTAAGAGMEPDAEAAGAAQDTESTAETTDVEAETADGEAQPSAEVTEAAPGGVGEAAGEAGPLPTNVGGGVPGTATTTADTVGIGSGASDAETSAGPSAVPGGGAMMLDIEGFASEIYERGFRQGYLRGVIETRDRLVSQMQQMQRQGIAGQPGHGGQAMPAQPGMMGQGGMGQDTDRGAVIVLPPGMTPQMFLEQLERMHRGQGGN